MMAMFEQQCQHSQGILEGLKMQIGMLAQVMGASRPLSTHSQCEPTRTTQAQRPMFGSIINENDVSYEDNPEVVASSPHTRAGNALSSRMAAPQPVYAAQPAPQFYEQSPGSMATGAQSISDWHQRPPHLDTMDIHQGTRPRGHVP